MLTNMKSYLNTYHVKHNKESLLLLIIFNDTYFKRPLILHLTAFLEIPLLRQPRQSEQIVQSEQIASGKIVQPDKKLEQGETIEKNRTFD